MRTGVLIVFIVIFLFLGLLIYKVKPYEFTDNSRFILNLLFNELNVIDERLNCKSLSIEEKNKLIERQKEIHYTLKQFFGKNLTDQ